VSRPFLDLGDGAELRELEAADAEEVYHLVDADRRRLREWMPWVDGTTSPSNTLAFIEHARDAEPLEGLGVFVDGAYTGGVGMRVNQLHGEAEIGYWIGAAWEGRGLVTRACRALLAHAFGELRLHRVSIRVAPGNRRSRAIPERLGFTQEAVLREAGRSDGQGYLDLVVYGMLDREWRS
jgi:ribosomal-protein-serine acetyltransferase